MQVRTHGHPPNPTAYPAGTSAAIQALTFQLKTLRRGRCLLTVCFLPWPVVVSKYSCDLGNFDLAGGGCSKLQMLFGIHPKNKVMYTDKVARPVWISPCALDLPASSFSIRNSRTCNMPVGYSCTGMAYFHYSAPQPPS